MKIQSQKEMILNYIAEFGSITNREAMINLGIGGLRARISELRREGFDIKAISETSKNRYGKDATYNRYYLDENRIKNDSTKTSPSTVESKTNWINQSIYNCITNERMMQHGRMD